MRYRFLALSIMLLLATAGRATEMRYLAWSDVRIVSPGVEDTGEVSFVASLGEADEWKSVEVSAFGRKFALDEKQLATLKGYPAYRIRMMCEASPERFGGHTVIWIFKRYYKDGNLEMEREIVVSVSKGEGFKMYERHPRPADW